MDTGWLKWLVSYGGIAFDLFIVPLLLWKRTRTVAFIVALFFHLFNSAVFQIGVFPYLAIALLVFFFPAEVIRKRFFKLKPKFREWNDDLKKLQVTKPLIYLLGIYFLIQILLPLRHHLYSGNVLWNEEGHRLSWRMMLRVKVGTIYFLSVDNNSGEQQKIYPRQYLTRGQSYRVATRPDMIWQFAQYIKRKMAEEGKDVSLYAYSRVSLNGRDYYPLVDESVDLAQVEWSHFSHSTWIMPMLE